MPDVSFTNLLVVAAIAVLAPLTVGFAPRLRIPAVVLEIIGGIIVGPSGFGWVRVDLPVQILALFGLAFLLFLAGLEIDVHQLRGRLLRFAVLGYLATLVLGYGAGASFTAAGWVPEPLLLAIMLSASGSAWNPSWARSWPGPLSAWWTAIPPRTRTSGSSWTRSATASWCQCSSWPFIVTATQIGVALGQLSSVTAAALVCAGLLSVLIFPLIALGLLRRNEQGPAAVPDMTTPVPEPHLM